MAYPEHVQDLIDEFAFLDDWEARYMHVIELGKALPLLKDSEYNDANKVKGCVSQVWLVTDPAEDGTVRFRGDSDAHIVKGLIALVIEIYSGRPAADILDIDAKQVFKDLDLAEHLSPQRSNGLYAMIGRIQRDARALAGA